MPKVEKLKKENEELKAKGSTSRITEDMIDDQIAKAVQQNSISLDKEFDRERERMKKELEELRATLATVQEFVDDHVAKAIRETEAANKEFSLERRRLQGELAEARSALAASSRTTTCSPEGPASRTMQDPVDAHIARVLRENKESKGKNIKGRTGATNGMEIYPSSVMAAAMDQQEIERVLRREKELAEELAGAKDELRKRDSRITLLEGYIKGIANNMP